MSRYLHIPDELTESDAHRTERLASELREGHDLEHVRERRKVRTQARNEARSSVTSLKRTATARGLTAKGRT